MKLKKIKIKDPIIKLKNKLKFDKGARNKNFKPKY
jgi:hypothetical protein